MSSLKPLVLVSGRTQTLPSATTLLTAQSTAANASLNLPEGAAPTSPADGDIWTTTLGMYVQIAGSTVGPLGTGGGGGTVTSVASADGSITVTNPTTTADLAVVKAPKLTTARTIAMSGDVVLEHQL
jgi:hypothetical protein